MKLHIPISALALGAVTAMPTAALADDPNDPAMRDPRARARDRAIIRQLNRNELARVRERDARYAEGWRAYRERPAQQAEHARRMARYEAEREQYERDMAEWRHAVARCRAGDWRYCQR